MPTTSTAPSSNSSEQIVADTDQTEQDPVGPGKRLRVLHRTQYTYGEPANRSSNELRLEPREWPWQRLRFFLLTIRPATSLRHYRDLSRNVVHFFEIAENHRQLSIESQLIVETWPKTTPETFPYGCPHAELAACHGMERCHEYLQPSHFVSLEPEIWKAAVDARDGSDDVFQTSYNIMRYVYENFRYDPAATQVSTSAGQAFEYRHGVCQDFAHVAIAMCRTLGIPARYVSGYLFDPAHDLLRGTQASHAWIEVFVKGRGGWFGFDPTNNKVVNEDYITVATGRDYNDVAPVNGDFFGGGAHRSLEVSVKVEQAD